MKTITMEYCEYKREIEDAELKGYNNGRKKTLSDIADFLNSNSPFWEWYWIKVQYDVAPPENWKVFLKALGRQDEVKIPENYNFETGELE